MTITYLTNLNLPAALLRYAEGDDVPFPQRGRFTKEEIRLAKWLRKGAFRRLQQTQPGLQYQFPDYQALMHAEIHTFAKRVLEKDCFAKWDEAILAAPRLLAIYTAIVGTQKITTNPNKRRNQQKEARRQAFREAIQDPRTLGELELFIVGKLCYGMPAWRNFDPRYDE